MIKLGTISPFTRSLPTDGGYLTSSRHHYSRWCHVRSL